MNNALNEIKQALNNAITEYAERPVENKIVKFFFKKLYRIFMRIDDIEDINDSKLKWAREDLEFLVYMARHYIELNRDKVYLIPNQCLLLFYKVNFILQDLENEMIKAEKKEKE